MVAPDHDRRRNRAAADEFVDRKPSAGAVAVAEPADPRRQALEGNALGRELEPPLEEGIVGEEPPQVLVDDSDVGRVAGESSPSKGPDPTAEERSDIGRDEARV